ncbi:MAG: response regulator [Armatimonadota bacterium]
MSDTIRLVVCDDSAEVREGVRAAVVAVEGIEVVGTGANGLEAVQLVDQLEPDVALLDVNMPVINGLKATAQITSKRPSTVVILMSAESGQAQLRRAILAGARDFLEKPFEDDELIAAIRRAYRRAQSRRLQETARSPARSDGKVVAVYGPRDGVGKTMLAVNLAVAAAVDLGRRTALADLCTPYGEAAAMMGLKPSVTAADLAAQAELPAPEKIDAALVGHPSGVWVLCGASKVTGADLPPELVRTVLSFLRSRYECVVVDTPPALDGTALAVLEIADQVLMMVMPERPLAVRAKAVLEALCDRRYPQEKFWLVVNRADSRAGMTVGELTDAVGIPVFASIPSDGMSVVPAMNHGVPLVTASPGSKAAQAVRALTRGVFGDLAHGTGQPRSGGRIRAILGGLRSKAG